MSYVQIIISLLVAVGLGGILGAYFQSLFQHRKQIKEYEHDLKRKRHLCIIILMLTRLDLKTGLPKVQQFRPDLKGLDDVEKELEAELLNSLLFASDEVIESISSFIGEPNYSNYVKTAIAMRKDLWGKKTRIETDILDIFKKKRLIE